MGISAIKVFLCVWFGMQDIVLYALERATYHTMLADGTSTRGDEHFSKYILSTTTQNVRLNVLSLGRSTRSSVIRPILIVENLVNELIQSPKDISSSVL